MLASRWRAALLQLAALASLSLAAPSSDRSPRQTSLKFNFGGEKVRGVNLGGWLLTEPWITPSIYASWPNGDPVRDEFTFAQTLGRDEAIRRLTAHWDSFITEADFHQIKAAGMNLVRIPIGHWSILPFPGEPYVQGAYSRLDRAINWAQAAGLKVMIDVHSAPGSQNGFDNSGKAGPILWMQTAGAVDHSLSVIRKLQADHGSNPAVVAIELLNEPAGGVLGQGNLQTFYTNGNQILKGSGVATAFSDAFLSVGAWAGFGGAGQGFIVDTHHYEVFGDQVSASINSHVASACGYRGEMTRGNGKFVICGEWTAALTDCAKWLNGVGRGARFDGSMAGFGSTGTCDRKRTGTVAGLTADEKTNMRRYIEAQLDAYEQGDGWVFWTWKTEAAPEWDMRALLAGGVFPQPLTSRQFPGQCR